MHPTIISRHFWPPLQASLFEMPGQFKEQVFLCNLQLQDSIPDRNHLPVFKQDMRRNTQRSNRIRGFAGCQLCNEGKVSHSFVGVKDRPYFRRRQIFELVITQGCLFGLGGGLYPYPSLESTVKV